MSTEVNKPGFLGLANLTPEEYAAFRKQQTTSTYKVTCLCGRDIVTQETEYACQCGRILCLGSPAEVNNART